MKIGNHEIGPGHPVFIVAELSGNHGGSFQRAIDLVLAAHKAAANAVKTQCFTPDTITMQSDRPEFRLTWNRQERTLYDLYAETAMPQDWHPRLKALCESLGMEYFASVFSPQDTDFMESLSVCAYKIASFELNDLPLIGYVASKRKPVILSTGMATEREVSAAQRALHIGDNVVAESVWLKCTSAYPSPLEASHLLSLKEIQPDWASWLVGLSDHTLSLIPPVVAVSLGACVIEKHLTLARLDGGPDSSFSLEPDEFAHMIQAVRDAEMALGDLYYYGPTKAEMPMLRFRRSLFAIQDIAEGEEITHTNVHSIRPGDGLPPEAQVWGRQAAVAIPRGTPLRWDLIARRVEP